MIYKVGTRVPFSGEVSSVHRSKSGEVIYTIKDAECGTTFKLAHKDLRKLMED